MDFRTPIFFWRHEEPKKSPLKGILIACGAVVATAAALVGAYYVFKKYFTVTIECEDCDKCDNPCDADEEEEVEEEEETEESGDATA